MEKTKRTVSAKSLKNLKPWVKGGPSPNPGGRPKKTLLSEAYKEILEQEVPNDPEKRTYAQLIALGQARKAIQGQTFAAVEMADRTEGKARQQIDVRGSIDVIVNRLKAGRERAKSA